MPGSLTYSGARYPLSTETDDVPADLLRFGTDIDQLLNLQAASVADRDAKYANVKAGTQVTCAALGIQWMKTTTPPTAAAWIVTSQSTAPVTSGVATYSSGFVLLKQGAKFVNGSVHVLIQGTYTGSDIVGAPVTDSIPGDIVNIPYAVVAASYLPPAELLPFNGTFRTSVAGGFWQMDSSGTIQLMSMSASARLRNGDAITLSASWPAQ